MTAIGGGYHAVESQENNVDMVNKDAAVVVVVVLLRVVGVCREVLRGLKTGVFREGRGRGWRWGDWGLKHKQS